MKILTYGSEGSGMHGIEDSPTLELDKGYTKGETGRGSREWRELV